MFPARYGSTRVTPSPTVLPEPRPEEIPYFDGQESYYASRRTTPVKKKRQEYPDHEGLIPVSTETQSSLRKSKSTLVAKLRNYKGA